jgi:anti-sigma-K factor RskA
MEPLTVHDLTAAYALDALEAREAREFEAHLATCADCQAELAQLGVGAGALAFAVESPVPPEALRIRILETARAERANVVPLRPRWAFPVAAVAAVAACAAIGFGIWAGSLSHSLDRERSAREDAARALSILSDPRASRLALTGQAGRGSLAVSENGDAAIVVSRLGRAPSGKTYEAWVIANGMPARAGTFTGGGDTSVLHLRRPVPNGALVAVTIERRPGVDQPSGPIVLSSKAV